jgi:hypothetical protein
LEPVQGSTALDFGTAIHAGLEAYYQPKTWGYHTQMQANALQGFLDSIRSTRCDAEDYEELKALGLGMLDNYFAWAPANDTWKPVMVEQEFEIPLLGKAVYQGRIDLIVQDDHGYWILDHKTTATFGSTEWLALDDQCSSYAWALKDELGLEVRGVIYNELRKKVPHRPKVLKNGSLSTDKSQETTHAIYLETIIDEGLDIEDYGGFLAYLSEYPKEFFRRTAIGFAPMTLMLTQRRILDEARDMLGRPTIYPSPSRMNCTGCAFLAPCIAKYEGYDFESILKENFRERKENGQ